MSVYLVYGLDNEWEAEHAGVFDTQEAAEAYADQLNQQLTDCMWQVQELDMNPVKPQLTRVWSAINGVATRPTLVSKPCESFRVQLAWIQYPTFSRPMAAVTSLKPDAIELSRKLRDAAIAEKIVYERPTYIRYLTRKEVEAL